MTCACFSKFSRDNITMCDGESVPCRPSVMMLTVCLWKRLQTRMFRQVWMGRGTQSCSQEPTLLNRRKVPWRVECTRWFWILLSVWECLEFQWKKRWCQKAIFFLKRKKKKKKKKKPGIRKQSCYQQKKKTERKKKMVSKSGREKCSSFFCGRKCRVKPPAASGPTRRWWRRSARTALSVM